MVETAKEGRSITKGKARGKTRGKTAAKKPKKKFIVWIKPSSYNKVYYILTYLYEFN